MLCGDLIGKKIFSKGRIYVKKEKDADKNHLLITEGRYKKLC